MTTSAVTIIMYTLPGKMKLVLSGVLCSAVSLMQVVHLPAQPWAPFSPCNGNNNTKRLADPKDSAAGVVLLPMTGQLSHGLVINTWDWVSGVRGWSAVQRAVC